MKAEKSSNFLQGFSRKTDILLLLRSIERRKDVLSAKMKSGVISHHTLSPPTEEIKKSSDSPPPRQSSALWKPSHDLAAVPQTMSTADASDNSDEDRRDSFNKEYSKNRSRRSSVGDYKPRWSVFSNYKRETRNSYRISAISALSSISDLDDDLELKEMNESQKNKSIFGTISRGRRSHSIKK